MDAHSVADNLFLGRRQRGPSRALAQGRQAQIRPASPRSSWPSAGWPASFAAFLDKLKATPEADGSGTLLDTSTVVWVKELGDGRLHDFKSVPFVIAGGGNGYWKTGRYLKLNEVPHQKLLVALGQSMGIAMDSFGSPRHHRGVGRADGMSAQPHYARRLARGTVLGAGRVRPWRWVCPGLAAAEGRGWLGGPPAASAAGSGGDSAGSAPRDCTQPTLAPRRIWRLTPKQYDNTLKDLLGVDSTYGAGFPADEVGVGFSNGRTLYS